MTKRPKWIAACANTDATSFVCVCVCANLAYSILAQISHGVLACDCVRSKLYESEWRDKRQCEQQRSTNTSLRWNNEIWMSADYLHAYYGFIEVTDIELIIVYTNTIFILVYCTLRLGCCMFCAQASESLPEWIFWQRIRIMLIRHIDMNYEGLEVIGMVTFGFNIMNA